MRGRSRFLHSAGVSAVVVLGCSAFARGETAPAPQQNAALSVPATSPVAASPALTADPLVAPAAGKSAPSAIVKPMEATGVSETNPTATKPTATGATPAPSPATGSTAAPEAPDAKTKSGKTADLDPEPPVKVPPPEAPVDEAEPASPAPVVAVPSAPLNAAIKKALDARATETIHGFGAGERRVERQAIADFYAAHDFAPLWSDTAAPLPAVDAVLARLSHAADDALSLPATPVELNVKGSVDDVAESDITLTEAVAAYVRQASGSRIDPRTIGPLIGYKPALAEIGEALDTIALAGADAGAKMEAYNPADPRYAALRDKLIELRTIRASPTASRIPAGPDLRVGMRDPRIPLIRSRFSLEAAQDDISDLRYDTKLAAAVAGFQRANGLPASGILTRQTVVALAGGHRSRIEGDLAANMEMWRWMPHDLGADRVEVNVPDFAVTVFKDDTAVDKHRVVVGKKDTPTPLFSNAVRYVVVNPVWNVPESIIKKEMLPKLAEDPDYLARLGYTVTRRHGRLVVQQPPGEKNALGRIKFLFPNDYAVYLHDTPSKALFASSRRAFSHGCVRVDQPFRFGETVLGGGRWSEKRLKSMLGDKERTLTLAKPLPIYIEYFTASVDQGGRIDLREDVYDYTRKVAAALGDAG